MTVTDADRKRLAAILGMLGSNAAGERDNAARLAEEFRRQHGTTWAQLVDGKTVQIVEQVIEKPIYIDRKVIVREPYRPLDMHPTAFWGWAMFMLYIYSCLASGGHLDGIQLLWVPVTFFVLAGKPFSRAWLAGWRH